MREPDVVEGAIRLWRCDEIEITIERGDPPAPDDATERRWAALCAENPRHFDGPVLSVESFDADAGRIAARVESYKRLVVQPDVDTGVTLLAVNGGVFATDETGREHVLMVRRHEHTRLYGGLWELGPAGGLEVEGASRLGLEALVAQLQVELSEEAGLDDALHDARVAGVYLDEEARSLDVLVRAHLTPRVESLNRRAGETHWDASDARWVRVDELDAFMQAHPCIPPTRAALWALGVG